jgi:hypothetical protein
METFFCQRGALWWNLFSSLAWSPEHSFVASQIVESDSNIIAFWSITEDLVRNLVDKNLIAFLFGYQKNP